LPKGNIQTCSSIFTVTEPYRIINYSFYIATAGEVNRMAERALVRLRQKLQGTEEGTSTSVSGQVNRLLQQARDPGNLSRLYHGWQPYL
jgi:phosphatidylinositol kinase/protein kinase (PI-3  family)